MEIFRLPGRLRRDLILLIAVKLSTLGILYLLFFSPVHRPVVDITAWLGATYPER